jgi:site-specific recombinase XerD
VPTKFPALRAFFRWLAKENLRADNPITKVTPSKVNEPLPKTVNEDHLAKTLNAIPLFRFAGLRDAASFASPWTAAPAFRNSSPCAFVTLNFFPAARR